MKVRNAALCICLATLFTVTMFGPPPATAAAPSNLRWFLDIASPEIKGESTVPTNKRWIEVISYGFHIDRDSGSYGIMGPLTIVKGFDTASPFIASAVFKGERFPEIVLEGRSISASVNNLVLRIVLEGKSTNPRITAVDTDQSAGEFIEKISIDEFDRIIWEYTVYSPSGKAIGTIHWALE